MPRYDLPDVARRLDDVLRSRRYEKGGKVDRTKAWKVIDRRIPRAVTRERFEELCEGEGPAMTAVEATIVSDGLGFDVRRLLYEEDAIPKGERPERLLDEIEQLWRVKM
jgi:hypothetical protein